ncbi:MAG: hypothetical protein ACLPMG_23020, partial [Terriglobales bacterium]
MTIHFSMTAYFLDNFVFDDNFIFGRLTPESLRLRKSAGLRPGTAEGGRRYAGFAGFQASLLEDRWILSRFNRAA